MEENRDACLAVILARGLARARKRDGRMRSGTIKHAKQNVRPDSDESPIIVDGDEVNGCLADNQNRENLKETAR